MSLKKHIMRFLKHAPGKRFQHYYHLINRRINHNIYFKIIFTVVGAIFVLIGLVLLFIPGPGSLFILAGVLLLCLSSQKLAKYLDHLEQKIRHWKDKNTHL